MIVVGSATAPHDVALPPQRLGRHARLPAVAIALARHALAGRELPPGGGIYFGTAYGDATETEAFVENMILNREEFPKPRAFAASVHNAMASRVAMDLHATGPNRTYVHGELSFWLALRAARRLPAALVGALDESTPLTRAGHETCARPLRGEGGGVLFCCADGDDALARIRFEGPADLWLGDDEGHPAWSAATAARAAAVLGGREPPESLGLSGRPRSIGLRIASRFGERGRIVLEAPA